MRIAALLGLLALAVPALAEDSFVPFVIPVEMSPESKIALPYEPLEEADRLTANEHFTSQAGRVRLWGVNFSFGANFPTHADAERVARRLAGTGVNAVRFHHMDSAKWPRGIWDDSGTALHPEALDRLDYFIDQLARHGIYSNLNLHVGKEHSRDLGLPPSPDGMDKMIAVFAPPLVERQKQYARDLLTHVNPYRKMRYTDDYAVGIVEITNENSLFMWSAPRVLPTLPEPYAEMLRKQYNAWLTKKYGDTATLKQQWAKGGEPLGENLLANGDFSDSAENAAAPSGWTFQQIDSARGKLETAQSDGQTVLQINPEQIDGTGWHLQLYQKNLAIEQGRLYTVAFRARSSQPRALAVSVMQDHADWANLGLYETIRLENEWKDCQLVFRATGGDANARVNFSFGEEATEFALADVTLRPGAAFELGADESLESGTVQVFGESESEPRRLDRMMFLAETEKAYFDGMRNYIKNDLGYKGLVTGTIVFGPLGLWTQSDMDFIDSHAYWQHPRFPNKPWDAGDWLIDQKAMSAHPEESTLVRLAAERLAGKPFTVTEYNHPAPLDSQAECVPMIASFAAAQDWDGVWLYTYSHTQDTWDRDHMNSYFDIDTNPAKWAFMPAGAFLYRFQVFPFLKFSGTYALTTDDQPLLESLADLHVRHGSSLFASMDAPWFDAVNYAVFRRLQGTKGKTEDLYYDFDQADPFRIVPVWESGLYLMQNGKGRVICGSMENAPEKHARYGGFEIESPARAVITVHSMDGEYLRADCRRILITACGRVENTEMQFSDDRRTVGREWGRGPVQIEAVKGTITLPLKSSGWTCHVLNPDGTVRQSVPVEDGKVELDPKYRTMWYLLERQ